MLKCVASSWRWKRCIPHRHRRLTKAEVISRQHRTSTPPAPKKCREAVSMVSRLACMTSSCHCLPPEHPFHTFNTILRDRERWTNWKRERERKKTTGEWHRWNDGEADVNQSSCSFGLKEAVQMHRFVQMTGPYLARCWGWLCHHKFSLTCFQHLHF